MPGNTREGGLGVAAGNKAHTNGDFSVGFNAETKFGFQYSFGGRERGRGGFYFAKHSFFLSPGSSPH